MNYNEKLDELFDKWINSLNAEQKSLFCKDGLIYKFGESENDINEKWEKAERRIVFLLKDKNPMEGDDIRKWLIEGKYAENNRDLSGGIISKSGLLPNIALMFYGLLTTQKNVRFGFDECESKMEEVRQTWNNIITPQRGGGKRAGARLHFPAQKNNSRENIPGSATVPAVQFPFWRGKSAALWVFSVFLRAVMN